MFFYRVKLVESCYCSMSIEFAASKRSNSYHRHTFLLLCSPITSRFSSQIVNVRPPIFVFVYQLFKDSIKNPFLVRCIDLLATSTKFFLTTRPQVEYYVKLFNFDFPVCRLLPEKPQLSLLSKICFFALRKRNLLELEK